MSDKKPSNSKIALDLETISDLADLLNDKGLSEIEIKQDGVQVRVARQVGGSIAPASPMIVQPNEGHALSHPDAAGTDPLGAHPGSVTSPMVGTVYLSPEPDAAQFVSIGSAVSEGQTLMIIEAMKTMNHIPAPRSGKVTSILVENGAPVEYGEPLVIIE